MRREVRSETPGAQSSGKQGRLRAQLSAGRGKRTWEAGVASPTLEGKWGQNKSGPELRGRSHLLGLVSYWIVRLTLPLAVVEPDVPVIGKLAVPVTVTFKVPDVDASVVESPR